MTDFALHAHRAAQREYARRKRASTPKVRVPFDPGEFKQCWDCPYATRTRCRVSKLGCP